MNFVFFSHGVKSWYKTFVTRQMLKDGNKMVTDGNGIDSGPMGPPPLATG